MAKSGEGDPRRVVEERPDEKTANNWTWPEVNACQWSKDKIKDLLVNLTIETTVGNCKITEIEKCEGNAYANRSKGFMAVYDWTKIKLKWKGKLRDSPDTICGTIEIRNFSSRSPQDLTIQFDVDNSRPESERLKAAFRSSAMPRIRGELDKYVLFLLDKLKRPSRQSSASAAASTNKPANKTNIWLKQTTGQATGGESSQNTTSDGDDVSNNSQPSNVDIFTDREGPGGMRVGRDFQVKVPQMLSAEERLSPQETNERALLVWSPSERLSETEVEGYLETSRDKYQYSGEQALGLLFWHRYDIDKSLSDLGNFTPHPEEWTVEDKVLFEQAFQFHGKAFDRIRQMLPDKSMSNLIRYYYKWKKFKNKTSVMDRQAKKFSQDGDEPALVVSGANNNNNKHPRNHVSSKSAHGNISDMESDDKTKEASDQLCANCGIPCTASKEKMCNTCFTYWKRTGEHRPLTGPIRQGDKHALGALRQQQKKPSGMFINHDDLNTLAMTTPQSENDATLRKLEKEVLDQKCRVQVKKQEIEILKRSLLTKDGVRFNPKTQKEIIINNVKIPLPPYGRKSDP